MGKRMLAAVLAVCGAAGAANADAILTFGFTDLSGSFNTSNMTFQAMGVDDGPGGMLRSQGDVSRLITPGLGTATYGPGQAAGRVAISMTISGVTANSALGSGSLVLRDADGDTLTAVLNGSFSLQGGAAIFTGAILNPVFADQGVPDATWDGPLAGMFPRTFAPAQGPFTGTLVQLHIAPPGGFFSSNFTGIPTLAQGAIIPAPAGAGVLGLGILALARRRRR